MSPSHNSSRSCSSAAALFDWTPPLPPHIPDPRCLQLCPSPDPAHNWPRCHGAPSPPSLSRTARGHTSVSRAQGRLSPLLHRRLHAGRPSIGVWCRALPPGADRSEMKSESRGPVHVVVGRAAMQRGWGNSALLTQVGLIGVMCRGLRWPAKHMRSGITHPRRASSPTPRGGPAPSEQQVQSTCDTGNRIPSL